MLRKSLLIAAVLALAACTAQQSTDAPADRDCFSSASARSFNVVDDRHVSVTVGPNHSYIMTTMWNARDLDWSHAIALRSTTGFICTGNGLGVEIIGGDPQRTYPISAIESAPELAPQGS